MCCSAALAVNAGDRSFICLNCSLFNINLLHHSSRPYSLDVQFLLDVHSVTSLRSFSGCGGRCCFPLMSLSLSDPGGVQGPNGTPAEHAGSPQCHTEIQGDYTARDTPGKCKCCTPHPHPLCVCVCVYSISEGSIFLWHYHQNFTHGSKQVYFPTVQWLDHVLI